MHLCARRSSLHVTVTPCKIYILSLPTRALGGGHWVINGTDRDHDDGYTQGGGTGRGGGGGRERKKGVHENPKRRVVNTKLPTEVRTPKFFWRSGWSLPIRAMIERSSTACQTYLAARRTMVKRDFMWNFGGGLAAQLTTRPSQMFVLLCM